MRPYLEKPTKDPHSNLSPNSAPWVGAMMGDGRVEIPVQWELGVWSVFSWGKVSPGAV
jgi:hypothetical protein